MNQARYWVLTVVILAHIFLNGFLWGKLGLSLSVIAWCIALILTIWRDTILKENDHDE